MSYSGRSLEQRALHVIAFVCVLAMACMVVAAAAQNQRGIRPDGIAITVASRAAAPAVKDVLLNRQRVISGVADSMTLDGPATYASHTDRMTFDMTWLDLVENRVYRRKFDLSAQTLSSRGDDGRFVEVTITTGAQGDLTVTTPNPQALRLAGLDRADEITPQIAAPRIIVELCATPLSPDHPRGAALRQALDLDTLAGLMVRRNAWRDGNAIAPSRCAR